MSSRPRAPTFGRLGLIICPNCSRENEDHYKFCLGCGTEISKATAAPKPRPMVMPVPVPTVVPAAVARPRVVSLHPPEVVDAPGFTTRPTADADATPTLMGDVPTFDTGDGGTTTSPIGELSAEAADHDMPFDVLDQPTPAMDVGVVARGGTDHPQALLAPPASSQGGAASVDLPFEVLRDEAPEDGAEEPGRSGDFLDASLKGMPAPSTGVPRLSARPTPLAAGPAASVEGRLCGSCGAVVPDGFKFCGVCGSRYEADRAAPDAFVPPAHEVGEAPARLVLIHPDGSEGATFPVGPGETTLGRSHPSSLFSEDPFLSPRHATFFFVKGQLFVRDEGSLNGVFLRIKAEVELFHWDMFRIGQQLLRFEEMSQVRPVMPGAGDGTTVMGSPVRGAWGRMPTIVAIDTTAAVWVLRKPEEFVGRERGDVVFNEDGFVSGAHAKISTRDGRYFLADLDSTNGTYLRIKGEGLVAPGDLLLLGQQLFKVEID